MPERPRPVAVAETLRDARARPDTLRYRPDIDGLRGLSVALVVAYHAFPKLRTGGFVGVDVFFVISGYLITQLVLLGLQAQTFSLGEFYARRVRRIVPALLVVLSAAALLGWLLLLPGEFMALGKSICWCASFLANVYFARTSGYFGGSAELSPLLHLWSLGVEEQFYIGWPILLMIAVRLKATMPVLLAVIVTSLAASIFGIWHAPVRFFFHPVPRAWELAIGGALAARQLSAPRGPLAEGRADRYRAWAGSLGGLALIVAGGLLWTAGTPVPGLWSVIPTTGAVLVIGAGAEAPLNRSLLGSQALVFLGRISYPLYLWHWLPFSFTRILLGHGPTPAWAAGDIVIAVAAAYATYRLVERPIRFGKRGRRAVPAALAALAALALTGAAMQAGWISGRLSGPIVSAWDAAVRDWRYPRAPASGMLLLPSHLRPKALFVGDSHIQQYWPRVAHVIEMSPDAARSALFAAYAGCVPLPGVVTRRPANRICDDLFASAMKRALEPDVDTVVFGASWESYFIGQYPNGPKHAVYGAADITRAPLDLNSAATQAVFEQFQQAVSLLVSNGRRVFIVLSNPSSPLFDPLFPPQYRLSLRAPRTLPDGPRVDAASFESFVEPLMSRLRAVAAHTGAKVLDPRSTLCDGMICPASDSNGVPLYLDTNHLSGFAARNRATFLDEILLDPRTQSSTSSP